MHPAVGYSAEDDIVRDVEVDDERQRYSLRSTQPGEESEHESFCIQWDRNKYMVYLRCASSS